MRGLLKDITEVRNITGKRILLRTSLNVPLNKEGLLLDAFRLKKALTTIQYLRKRGARVIICGHIGRDPHASLKPIFDCMRDLVPGIKFAEAVVGPHVRTLVKCMKDGDVIMLENVRREHGETENDETFAKELASTADIFVNDAFADSHREHASIIGVPKFLPSYAGLLFKKEADRLTRARNPEHPALFILGGAKFETKQPLVEKFLSIYDHVFVAGALANDFFAAEGLEVGRSLVSSPPADVKHLLHNPKIILPSDVVVLTHDGRKVVKKPDEVEAGDMINDSGPATLKLLEPIIKNARFILWNGPLGEYQLGFIDGTKGIIEIVARSNAESIVGGGDTMSLIEKYGLEDAFTFCSTAGGAMLEFLLNGSIAGSEAIRGSAHA